MQPSLTSGFAWVGGSGPRVEEAIVFSLHSLALPRSPCAKVESLSIWLVALIAQLLLLMLLLSLLLSLVRLYRADKDRLVLTDEKAILDQRYASSVLFFGFEPA